jgi:hypothetical protein
MNHYAIRLTPEQSLCIFGLWNAKTTLVWNDVLKFSKICLRKCVSSGVCARKLYNMQPDIKEWIKYEKTSIEDYELLEPWHPDPFKDFHCNIGDLVMYRKFLTPQILSKCGITFDILKENYGLTPDLMVLLRYNISDWIELGITENFIEQLYNSQPSASDGKMIPPICQSIFGMLTKNDVLQQIKRHKSRFG